jgi:hypothetical protein
LQNAYRVRVLLNQVMNKMRIGLSVSDTHYQSVYAIRARFATSASL